MWVAAVVLYGHTFWVFLLAGKCPRCCGLSGPSHVHRVAWRYRVKPGGEHGGSGGVILGGDEVQQGPWSVEGCQAALPARAWFASVIVSDWLHVCLRGVVFWDGPGGMVPLDSVGSVFVPVGGEQQDGEWCPAFS